MSTVDLGGWQPIASAPRDGVLCELRFRDNLGYYEIARPHFLHDDGRWYAVDPPRLIERNPVGWRPWDED